MSKRIITRKAFTLLEIIISLSMVVLILASVYGTYTAATRSLGHFRSRDNLQKQARVFLQRIASEIRCCYAGYEDESLKPSLKAIQTETTKHIQKENALFEGGKVSSGRSFIRFVTSAVTSKRERSIGGLAIVKYMLDDSTYTLSRSKRRYIDGFEADGDDSSWFVILKNVQDITVEYFDGKKWLKEWNSNDMKKSLPKAVGISVVMQSEDIGPLKFSSTVQIVCREYQSVSVVKTITDSTGILQNNGNNQKSDD